MPAEDALYLLFLITSINPCLDILSTCYKLIVSIFNALRANECLNLEFVSTFLDALQVLIDINVALVNFAKTLVNIATCTRSGTLNGPTSEILSCIRVSIWIRSLGKTRINDKLSSIVAWRHLALEFFINVSLYLFNISIDFFDSELGVALHLFDYAQSLVSYRASIITHPLFTL